MLLPIAALSGWLSARNSYKKRFGSQQNGFDPDYFKGLNYLLNEQPDKPIEVFIGLLEVNSDTVETHLALANLFRRRGEIERAIRIHQNLIARPTLKPSRRDQALIELGLDYMSAGVLNRAENLFLELLNRPSSPTDAYRHLLGLYQQQKHWQKAINMAKKLQSIDSKTIGAEIAQLYCELAEHTLDNDDLHALPFLKQAKQSDANCVRAVLLEATVYIQSKQYSKALKSMTKIEQQPSLEGLHYLLSMGKLGNQVLLPLVNDITESLLQHGRRYVCQHCGSSGKTMHWHCPGCQHWGTVLPTEFHFSSFKTTSEH